MSGDLHAGIALGVNIDHVATLRQARRARYPDPVHAALIAEEAGADSITLHLREDRRHIQDRDLKLLRETCQTLLNLEMAATQEMVKIAYEQSSGALPFVDNHAGVVVDAAFGRYLREAADYAGGRREVGT